MPVLSDPTHDYLPRLLAGETRALASMFDGLPVIDDPISGRIAGHEMLTQFAIQKAAWLIVRQVRLEHIRTTRNDQRTVVEWVLHLVQGKDIIQLPVAIVGAHAGGKHLRMIRVYHSMWPLIGTHRVREAFLPAEKRIHLSDVVAEYQRALAAGDVEAIVRVFEPDGYFREPAGGQYIYLGTPKLHEFMNRILGSGGILLEHNTVTDDGVACAIEFNAVQFGPHRLIPQAGVAIYERGASGKLHAARIYDDVNVEAYAS